MLGRAGDESVRIRPHHLGKIARVVEVRMAEEDELGLDRRQLLGRGADVSDSRPRRVRETSRPGDIGIQNHDVTLEGRGETADSKPGEDHAIAAHRSGLRVDVLEAEERVVDEWRLFHHDVEPRGGDLLRQQRVAQGVFVHDGAATRVDEDRVLLHHRELARAHHLASRVVERHVEADHV